MRLELLACGLLAVMAAFSVEARDRDSGTSYAYDAMKSYLESGEFPGGISIYYKDGVQETCCMGYADVAAKRKITLNDSFMQCSQTKGFCGVSVAILVERGLLDLDDPVSKYLPEFSELWVMDAGTDSVKTLHRAKNVLTLRMCLNHTGGFSFDISAKRRDVRGGGWSGGCPLRQAATVAAESPILFEPGTVASYSNTGFDIAAAVVEVVSGMRWEQFLQKEIFDPLGMKSTTFWPTERQLRHKIEMYHVRAGRKAEWVEEDSYQQRPYNGPYVFPSAGAGLWTTANDQLKFYKMLMNLGVGDNGVRVLEEETVKSLLAVSSRPAQFNEGYSLGLQAPLEDSEDAWFGHGGAWGTECYVNWHRKYLSLWVEQLPFSERPWYVALIKAQQDFFDTDFSAIADKTYTGRTK